MAAFSFLLVFMTIGVLVFSIIFFYCSQRQKKSTKTFILFIDAPDPDNPAAAAAILKYIPPCTHLHIVLTGRPLDLKIPKTGSKLLTNSDITRQDWEVNVPLHSEKVLEDSASRLTVYLENCGINVTKDVTMYHGGVAPTAPLSDVVHDWDFLFDRKDLITGHDNDQGHILSPTEYTRLVDQYSSLSAPDRVDQLLSVLRPFPLTPLSVLANKIKAETCEEVVMFLGGPATAVVKLFKHSEDLSRKVSSLYGMFGSLSPGDTTLLDNQFNVACDIDGACDLFIDNLFPNAIKYLVTTETAKNSLLLLESKHILDMNLSSNYFYQLHRLWEHTHNDRVQPLFDVIPVLAYLDRYKDCFTWSRKKAMLYEWQQPNKEKENGGSVLRQQFVFIDSDEVKHPLVSGTEIRHFNRKDFVQFMINTWRHD